MTALCVPAALLMTPSYLPYGKGIPAFAGMTVPLLLCRYFRVSGNDDFNFVVISKWNGNGVALRQRKHIDGIVPSHGIKFRDVSEFAAGVGHPVTG